MMFTKHRTNKMYNKHQLFEGLEMGDLARLIHPELHIDEFKSKMGADEDIIVLSFKVDGKQPALDLMNFVERGYDWVLDSDVSSGELDDGQYLVFVEMERDTAAAKQIVGLLKDIMNLTKQDLGEWNFNYRKSSKAHDITEDEIKSVVPLTPEAYQSKFDREQDLDPSRHDSGDEELDRMLGAMQEAARVPMNRRAPVNDWTESLRVAAGLK